MRVFSGIQPTGSPHLGNYFGAFVNWKKLQDDGHECFYSIVNQHAITVVRDKEQLKKNTLELAAMLLAMGLDKSTIFIQSDVPAHVQLAWILSCLTPMGEMGRMIQFKEKSADNAANVNVGLFAYPILQAADVLLYKTELVPVGIDQSQHLELARLLAKKFNNVYKKLFPEPKTLHTKTTKVVGLDGSAKMSKSLNNYLGLDESETVLWDKLRVAATDPARVTRKDPGNPYICNIYALHTLLSPQEDIDWVISGCKGATIGCIECKKKLFENMMVLLRPIQERYKALMSKPDDIRDVLAQGAKKANDVANKTLQEVEEAIGFFVD